MQKMTTKAGRRRTRWKLKPSKMTAMSPSPNTLVKSCLRSVPLLLDDFSLFEFCCPFLCPGSVFCVSLDPATNSLAVTGGEDDKAYVWKVSDGEVVLECTGES